MGAPAQLSNASIAENFARIYYQVAAGKTDQLHQLYGENSNLSHETVNASGLAQIHSVASSLPVKRGPPQIHSIDAQDASSGIMVLVSGSLTGQLFTQAFLLERVDEEKHKYVCANDMYRTVSHENPRHHSQFVKPVPTTASPQTVVVEQPVEAATAPTSTPVQAQPPAPAPIPTVVPVQEQVITKSATGNKDDVDVGSPAPAPVPAPAPSVSIPANSVGLPPDNVAPNVQLPPDNTVALPPDSVVALPPDNVVPLPSDNSRPRSNVQLPPVNTSQRAINSQPVKLPSDNKAPAVQKPQQQPTQPQPTKSVPAKPKSWAAIVSKPGAGIGVSAPVAQTPVNSYDTSSVNVPTPAPAKQATAVPPPVIATENKTMPSSSVSGGSAPQPTSPNYRKDKPAAGGSGKFSGYKGAARQFGPSAVVQLNSCGNWSGKHRELSIALRDEFGQYGHPVKHVEVKGSRGIIFVEYDTLAGVEAAVEAWKTPRNTGKFAGIALSVSEKRFLRRPQMRGRGNGPQRGARRATTHHRNNQDN